MVGVKRRLVGAAIVGGALVLGGCGDAGLEPEPTPTATAEPSAPEIPTAAPTPSTPAVTKPERPADMDRTDEVGAAAAAEYFLSLYSYVMQTGDLVEWDAMSWETCNFCSDIRQSVLNIAASGDTYVGGKIRIADIRVFSIDEELGGYPVDAAIVQDSSQRFNSAGDVVEDNTGRDGSVRVDTWFTAGKWVILAIASPET